MKYLAVLGRQPEISIAELNMRFSTGPAAAFSPIARGLAMGVPQAASPVDIGRLGGTLKLAIELEEKPLKYLQKLPEGKITIGVSDYSERATRKSAQGEALRLKKILVRHGRSVRVVENKEASCLQRHRYIMGFLVRANGRLSL